MFLNGNKKKISDVRYEETLIGFKTRIIESHELIQFASTEMPYAATYELSIFP